MTERRAIVLRFSREPQRGHQRPLIGPEIMATSRGSGAAAPKRRPGTARAIDEALKATNKGFERHGLRCTARVASFFEGGGALLLKQAQCTCHMGRESSTGEPPGTGSAGALPCVLALSQSPGSGAGPKRRQ
jgi:hypothetical protein